MTDFQATDRWFAGRYRTTHWVRFLPIHVTRLWSGPRRWRDVRGLGLGFGPFVFYIGRW